ncbi:hypothetical protein QBC34DRAFT_396544 [Podospora aff. communis PSN243]|uniref:FAD synthase n=1 Tax=Podospora aff. communis PSN243 TaxID=3040156 RepID=A0AAV9GZQ3_9PEZI|nr:hypothetical protein QBC34DRAFT_396544 [Podospora aff. communis PSN243]
MTQDLPRTNGVAKTASADGAPRAAAAVPRQTSKTTLPEICYTLRRKVIAFLDGKHDDSLLQDTQSQVRVAMGVIEKALQRYEPDQLSLAYNGGKDCLVLLVLILSCLPSLFPEQPQLPPQPTPSPTPSPPPQPLQAIYIAPPDPFPEVEDFVATSTQQYHLDLLRYALPMRRALESYLSDRPSLRAIFMGTRRTDPHSEFLEHFSPTDADWPQFMRVNPLIDWHYAEIWAFIRQLELPFCCLYERGFSSLGGVTNTRPNPALALDAEGKSFRPAYELVRDDEERLGRDR